MRLPAKGRQVLFDRGLGIRARGYQAEKSGLPVCEMLCRQLIYRSENIECDTQCRLTGRHFMKPIGGCGHCAGRHEQPQS